MMSVECLNHCKQHVPGFVNDGEGGEEFGFSTTAELLASALCQRQATYPDFSQFALSDNCLMAIYDDGFSWRVVGYITKPELVDLPAWQGAKFRVLMPNGEATVIDKAKMYSTSCGEVTLKGPSGTRVRILTKAEFESMSGVDDVS